MALSANVQVRLDPELYDIFRQVAEVADVRIAAVIREALTQWIADFAGEDGEIDLDAAGVATREALSAREHAAEAESGS